MVQLAFAVLSDRDSHGASPAAIELKSPNAHLPFRKSHGLVPMLHCASSERGSRQRQLGNPHPSEVAQFSKCRSQHLLGCAKRAQFRIQQQSKGGFMTCCLRHRRLHTSSCHGRWPLQPILAILTAWPLRARRSEFGHVARASAVHVENDE